MNVRAALCLALACIGAWAPGVASAGDWFRVESPHFVVTSNGAERVVLDHVRELESFRQVGLLLLGVGGDGGAAQAPFDVWLLRNSTEVQALRPFGQPVAGVYFHCVEGSTAYGALRITGSRSDDGVSRHVLFHEYAHHLMFQYARITYPAWYVEGFAEYLGSAEVEGGRVRVGAWDDGRARMLDATGWLPFERVLDPRFGDKEMDTKWWADSLNVQRFYAQSWLLAHYVLADGERTRRFAAYFARVAAGGDPLATFEPATGIAVEDLKTRLRQYRQDMAAVSVPVAGVPDAALRREALPDDADGWLLDASLLRTCPAKAQGEAILARLRGPSDTLSAGHRLALDRGELLYGDPGAALADLDKHAVADDALFDAHHLRGRALMQSADAMQGDARAARLREARKEFFAAYRLRKLDATNLWYLARAMAFDGVNANVANAARGAHALAPGVGDFARLEALVDLETGDRELAMRALAPLASDPHATASAARAKAAIEAIRAGKGRAEVERLLDAPAPEAAHAP